MSYSKEQIKKALELYQQCKSVSQTVRILGYPTRENLYKWISLLKEAKISRSMSKKGCSPDNSACESFFGRIKNEMFYSREWSNVSLENFKIILNDYLMWYNIERIKISLGFKSPEEYRQSLGLI